MSTRWRLAGVSSLAAAICSATFLVLNFKYQINPN
jgi:hypothetical protein